MRRFRVSQIPLLHHTDASEISLDAEESRHVRNVLRLSPGETVRLFDGAGVEWDGEIIASEPSGVRVRLLKRVANDSESPVDITIAQGFLKEKKMESLVPPLTELGVRRFVPFFAERSVARPDAKRLRARKERWEKLSAESLKQCRRSRVMEITEALPFGEMIQRGASADVRLIFWEERPAGFDAPVPLLVNPCETRIIAVLGPEGGLSNREVTLAEASGFVTAGLGPRILKAETAAIAAAALIQYFFGDMRKKH